VTLSPLIEQATQVVSQILFYQLAKDLVTSQPFLVVLVMSIS